MNLKIILFCTLSIVINIGCFGGKYRYKPKILPPVYEKIMPHFGEAKTYCTAKNIKISNENGRPRLYFDLTSESEYIDTAFVHKYFFTITMGVSTCGNGVFQPNIIKFFVDGELMTFNLASKYALLNFDYKTGSHIPVKIVDRKTAERMSYRDKYKYYYDITESQIHKIASSKNVIVFYTRSFEPINHGFLLQEDINRFQVFLIKYVAAW